MKPKAKRGTRRNIANTFGALGYLFSAMQWLWATILYLGVLQSVILFLSSPTGEQAEPIPQFTLTLPDPFEMAMVIAITVIVVALAIYALIKMPFVVAKTGRKIVYETTEKVVPVVIKAQHKQDTKKRREILTPKVVFVVKILLVIIPVVLTIGSGLLKDLSIDYSIAVVAGGGLAGFSVALFATQYSLASLLHIKRSDLW